MKRIVYLALVVCFAMAACTAGGSGKEEQELTPAEKRVRDSLSKIRQRMYADSLKKTNPLLIVPPDSTYTGTYVDKYESGITKFRGFFRMGKRHGQWMSFYPSGLLWSEMNYDKGLRDGPNITYFEHGLVRYTGYYKNDLKDSLWKFYDSTGVLVSKAIYHKGKLAKEMPVK